MRGAIGGQTFGIGPMTTHKYVIAITDLKSIWDNLKVLNLATNWE